MANAVGPCGANGGNTPLNARMGLRLWTRLKKQSSVAVHCAPPKPVPVTRLLKMLYTE